MNDFEMKIKKNSEQCINILKNAIPNVYNPLYMTSSGKIIRYKYLFKIKNNCISIISTGIGYWPVICRIKIIKNNESETVIIANFNKNILYRLINCIITILGTFCSVVYFIGELFIDNSRPIGERIIYVIFAAIVTLCFVTYYLYNKKTRYKEKNKILCLLNSIFENNNLGI